MLVFFSGYEMIFLTNFFRYYVGSGVKNMPCHPIQTRHA